MTEIIKLKDDAVIDFYTNHTCYDTGCPTCGYGSCYCTEMEIYFINHSSISFELDEMYGYNEDFSLGYFMRLFGLNFEKFSEMTVDEFINFTTTEIKKDFKNVEIST